MKTMNKKWICTRNRKVTSYCNKKDTYLLKKKMMMCQECSQLSLFISQTSDFGIIFLLWHISNPQGHMSGYDMLSSLIFDLNQHTSALSTCHHHEIPFQSSVDFRRTALHCPFQTDNSDNQLIKINQLWLKWTSHYKYCMAQQYMLYS